MKVNLVSTWQQKAPDVSAVNSKVYCTQRYCKLIELNTSSYYAIKARQALPAVIKPEQVALKSAFTASGQTYGKHIGRIAPNVLQQNFKVTQVNTVWVADITYIRTQSGWLYLAAVMDLYARKIVGWALASPMQASLVCSALNMAIIARQPAPGLIVHTDQGCQYASDDYLDLLAKHKLTASMSGRGNCYDNAVMERVWQTHYANHQEAIRDISHYIVAFYNACRLHSTLGYLSPNQFEANLTELHQNTSIGVSSYC